MFDDLVALAELTLKFAVLGLTAGLRPEFHAQKYAIEYDLVRADSVGSYAGALQELISGETRRGLDDEARKVQAELTTPVDRASSAWQATAIDGLVECCGCLDIELKLKTKISGRQWFDVVPQIRNRVRHGSLTTSRKAATIEPLERAVLTFIDNFALFSRPWFYARRQVSGKVTTFPLRDDVPVPSETTLEALTEGIYISFDEPRRVPLLESDETLRDVWVPNGGYSAGRFELLCYVSDTRRSGDGAQYQNPPIGLPASETQGLGALEPEGQTFANLPPAPRGYVNRLVLERDLTDLLSDDRHPIVTLHGGGGVGKTSLALTVLHRMTTTERFVAMMWFSARDVDLAPTGPRAVRPHLVTVSQISDACVELLRPSERSDRDFDPPGYVGGLLELGLAGSPLLFAFDNFETVAQPSELFRWLDTHIRPPNKVLITTRHRAFKADFPLEIGGMTREEFGALVSRVAAQVGVDLRLSTELVDELFEHSGGSPYIAKVLLGQMAHSTTKRPKRLVANRADILDALFDRSFAAAPVEAQRVFLVLSRAGEVPLVALQAVLIRSDAPSVDVESTVEWLADAALLELDESAGADDTYVRIPMTAASFGKRRLQVSPLRGVVEADVSLLRLFGVRSRRRGVTEQFEHFVRHAAGEIRRNNLALEAATEILSAAARNRPSLWPMAADLYDEFGKGWTDADAAAEALRNYLEFHPEDGDIWLRLANTYATAGDRFAQVSALVERAELPSTPAIDLGYAAARLLGALADGEGDSYGQSARDWLIDRLITAMMRRVTAGEGTDYGELAWLYLHRGDQAAAMECVQQGLVVDPGNPHCRRLAKRLGMSLAVDTRLPGSGERPDEGRPETGGAFTDDDIRSRVCAVIDEIRRGERASELHGGGMAFAAVAPMVRAALPEVDPTALGFRNLSQLVETYLEGTDFELSRVGGHPRLVLRTGHTPAVPVASSIGATTSSGDSLQAIIDRHRIPETEIMTRGVVTAKIIEVVGALGADPRFRHELVQDGMRFATVGYVLHGVMPNLEPKALGYRNLSQLAESCLAGTPFTFVTVDNHPRLVMASGSDGDGADAIAAQTPNVPRRFAALVEQRRLAMAPPVLSDTIEHVLVLASSVEQQVEAAAELREQGLPFETFAFLISLTTPGLTPARYGFRNLTTLVGYCFDGTDFALAERIGTNPPAVCLVKRRELPDGMAVRESQSPRDVHSADYYRELLGTGGPMIKIPPVREFRQIVDALQKLSVDPRGLGEWIDCTSHELTGRIATEKVKAALLALLATNIFHRRPSDRPLREQQLEIREEYDTSDTTFAHIWDIAHDKLAGLLGTVNDATLAEIVPAVASIEEPPKDSR